MSRRPRIVVAGSRETLVVVAGSRRALVIVAGSRRARATCCGVATVSDGAAVMSRRRVRSSRYILIG